jgi:hypothetical protein
VPSEQTERTPRSVRVQFYCDLDRKTLGVRLQIVTEGYLFWNWC